MFRDIEALKAVMDSKKNSSSVRQYANELMTAQVITDAGMRVIAIGLIEGFWDEDANDLTVLAVKPKAKRHAYVLGRYVNELKPSEKDPTQHVLQWSGGSYDWDAFEAIIRFIERTNGKIVWADLEWRTH